MSEKHPLLAAEEECFYLTSPFIEPDGPERSGSAVSVNAARCIIAGAARYAPGTPPVS
jgi:hypothetical protein